MAKTGQEVPRCAYPGCENEPPPGEAAAAAEPRYCGRPDPVTGEPHTALTAFRRRQVLARQGGGVAGMEDPDRPGFAFWRRRQRAEAEAGQARAAVAEADARLAEALAAKAAAEQEAVAAQGRAAEAERAAQEQVAAVYRERDEAVRGAESRVAQAESRARDAEQEAARAREAAESARAELDRAGRAADRQVAQARQDAARDQAELRAGLEAQIAAAEEARAGLQARAEQAEAEAGQGAPRRRRLRRGWPRRCRSRPPPSGRRRPRGHGPPRLSGPRRSRWPRSTGSGTRRCAARSPGRPRPSPGPGMPSRTRPGRRTRPRRPAQTTPRLSRRVAAPTVTRRPGRQPDDNPEAQRAAADLREKVSGKHLRTLISRIGTGIDACCGSRRPATGVRSKQSSWRPESGNATRSPMRYGARSSRPAMDNT